MRSAEHGGSDLSRSHERDLPYAHVAGGPGLPDRVIKRLLCSGRIRTVVHGQGGIRGGNVRDLGRSHRVVTDRQFRALVLRDGGCTHPGCAGIGGLEAHHVRHWIYGGRTDLSNLVLLCGRHHHSHHDGEFRIEALSLGRFRFVRSDGFVLAGHIDPAQFIHTTTPVEDEHRQVTTDAAATRWDGQRMNRPWATAVLAERRERHQHAS